jgi:hypothetical protein
MSAGCSLDDAFPDAVPRLPGSNKKKRSATKGPALAFLKGIDSDPDRPFVGGAPVESAKSMVKEGFRSEKEFKPQDDDPTVDIIGKGPVTDSYGHTVSSYFGKSETHENLSDFSPAVEDKTGYILDPVFPAKLPTPDSLPPSANINDAWKPLVNRRGGGIETAFFAEKPSESELSSNEMKENLAMIRRQIDTLYARLESLEHRRGEFSHSELGLFIVTGLFLMFGLDTVRRMK